MITIVDYGMGNLRSVQKAFEGLGFPVQVTGDANAVRQADRLILPGVGAFRDAIAHLHEHQLTDAVREFVDSGRPFLGICLGLQLLFDQSYEDGLHRGLGIFPGEVVRFERPAAFKIPHMGWNGLNAVGDNPLLRHLPAEPIVYFVHSYHVVPQDRSIVAATTDYGGPFVSMVARDYLFAAQFHPEKSQRVGLKILENFGNL